MKRIVAIVVSATLLMLGAAANAEDMPHTAASASVRLPLVQGWYNGQVTYYIQTEASDPQVAQQQNVNYVPRLANAANTEAVDDIYAVTNFQQSNVIPSAPIPAGPTNANAAYSPLWQVSLVTWNPGTTPQVLHSEAEVLAAQTSGQVNIQKTNIIVNCPVIFTPEGGVLPTAKITIGHGRDHDRE